MPYGSSKQFAMTRSRIHYEPVLGFALIVLGILASNFVLAQNVAHCTPSSTSCPIDINLLLGLFGIVVAGLLLVVHSLRVILRSRRGRMQERQVERRNDAGRVSRTSAPMSPMVPRQPSLKDSKRRLRRLIIVSCVLVLLIVVAGIFLLYQFEYYGILGYSGSESCYNMTPSNLPCNGEAAGWGQIVAINSTTAPGFLGIGHQTEVILVIFVSVTGSNFTQKFLGCNSFQVGDTVPVFIYTYNQTFAYRGTPTNITLLPDYEVTNASFDKTTTITYQSSSTSVTTTFDEIGRIYEMEPPSGCAKG